MGIRWCRFVLKAMPTCSSKITFVVQGDVIKLLQQTTAIKSLVNYMLYLSVYYTGEHQASFFGLYGEKNITSFLQQSKPIESCFSHSFWTTHQIGLLSLLACVFVYMLTHVFMCLYLYLYIVFVYVQIVGTVKTHFLQDNKEHILHSGGLIGDSSLLCISLPR